MSQVLIGNCNAFAVGFVHVFLHFVITYSRKLYKGVGSESPNTLVRRTVDCIGKQYEKISLFAFGNSIGSIDNVT